MYWPRRHIDKVGSGLLGLSDWPAYRPLILRQAKYPTAPAGLVQNQKITPRPCAN